LGVVFGVIGRAAQATADPSDDTMNTTWGALDDALGASAQGFVWRADAARQQRRLGPLASGLLIVEVLTQGGLHDGEYETRVLTAWYGPDSHAPRRQVLFEGFGSAHASAYHIALEGPALVLAHLAAPDNKTLESRWLWQPARGRFERLRPSPSPEVSALLALLDHNRLPEAHDALDALTRADYDALSSHADLLFERLLRATYRAARARSDMGCATEAAALLVGLIGSPPLLSAALIPPDDAFILCVGATPEGGCEGGFNHLPSSSATAALLNDCAALLTQGGYAHLAAPLLRQVITSFPAYAAAHLNLADALWATGHLAESRTHYRWLSSLYHRAGPNPSLPDHVFSRLSDAAPQVSDTTDAADP
jgi:hypothetical protein